MLLYALPQSLSTCTRCWFDQLLRRSRFTRLGFCSHTFFVQAEDGIRYIVVTGVQTCALPIFGRRLQVGVALDDGEEVPRRVDQLPLVGRLLADGAVAGLGAVPGLYDAL